MSDDWGLMENYDEQPICPECEYELAWECCYQCDGSSVYGHDCGEDCCACLEPEENEPCDECSGIGGWYYCANPQCKIVRIERQHA